MPNMSRRSLLCTGAGFALSLSVAPLWARDRIAKTNGLALRGYDTTAYFKHNKPIPGSADHVVGWHGANWQFSSEAEADLFIATPNRFAPQFGGYCTRAMSLKKLVPADPKVWRIKNDKLYVFAKPVGGTVFDKSPDDMITKAAAYWATVG